MFAIGGINFPLGVPHHWLTTNLWSMGQQFWVIRNNPQPGDARVRRQREARRGQEGRRCGPATTTTVVPEVVEPAPARNQPKRQSRKKRKGS